MDQSASPGPVLFLRDRAGGIIATGTVLALLYFGRDVLVPITLAMILSLLIAPLVRLLRKVGLGQTSSVLVAVLALTVSFTSVAAVIGMQVVRMAASLPQYEKTIQLKLKTLNEQTVGRLNALTGQAGRLIDPRIEPRPAPRTGAAPAGSALTSPAEVAGAAPAARPAARPVVAPVAAPAVTPVDAPAVAPVAAPAVTPVAAPAPIPVELHEPPPSPLQVIQRVFSSVWVPLETAGIVLVVLVFVLLEQEALRDRFIRIAGGTDIRATTLALNDAGERLSRFFVSQFAMNLAVGVAIWIGLAIVGMPHALLWGALAGVLRFVPYVGVWIAAMFSVVLGAAVDPGWSLALSALGLFVIVELVAGQLIEPQLYGHTTGLSPLSVVIAAIFWSWLWGPIGLIVSTPLTLCLVVAGRHIKALSLLDILLGDNQALTMPQRFYQRALSADADEIIAGARAFLKRNSFAAYCDRVLMPALYLARLDLDTGAITPDQQVRVREAIVAVIGAIGGEKPRFARRGNRTSVLDRANAGRELRQQREKVEGQWQGPLVVPKGSVMLCMGLGSSGDDLAAELLVRILRDQKVDARHMLVDELNLTLPPEAQPSSISVVYLVSAFPSDERERGNVVADAVRTRFPHVCIVSVLLPGMLLQPGPTIDTLETADKAATSFGHAVQICLSLQDEQRNTA